jgi:hypothetical protein
VQHDDLQSMRERHPGWRLLRADSAPLIAASLHRAFIAGNVRTITEADLLEAVDDVLYDVRASAPDAYPRLARQYVTDWADTDRGWLRKFYPSGSDVPSYDLTPATEKALAWLGSLQQRSFIGTESRLLTLFQLLEQIVEGSQEDPAQRLAVLQRRRDELDAEIERVQRGEVAVLAETAVRDRFQQFTDTARGLLSDFREVEENFRLLDRAVRERIASWDGARGALLDDVFGERDAITSSDQGASFAAFWDFLMSSDRQESFGRMLEQVMAMPGLGDVDGRLRYVVHDWLKAADAVQATVAHLSQQLRRFLDDRAFLENRRIAELVRSIESAALAVRDAQPAGDFTELDDLHAAVVSPMSRRLYQPAPAVVLDTSPVAAGDQSFDAAALFAQFTVDRQRLQAQVAASLAGREQVSLAEVVSANPITQGLAEVVTYLSLADADAAVFDDGTRQQVTWAGRAADVPLIVFTAEGNDG